MSSNSMGMFGERDSEQNQTPPSLTSRRTDHFGSSPASSANAASSHAPDLHHVSKWPTFPVCSSTLKRGHSAMMPSIKLWLASAASRILFASCSNGSPFLGTSSMRRPPLRDRSFRTTQERGEKCIKKRED